ncbi:MULTISPECIES: hypothetical protein [Pseudoalteromonas]|uniref:hypothetical protein n=1 Tax=Pseudoalteromonas TaxID=53246 RepID=UPI0003023CF4|nr:MULTISPECIES: hypothetical protein [Pseudoalteromonas]
MTVPQFSTVFLVLKLSLAIVVIQRQKVNFNTLNYGIAGNYDNLPARLGLALQVK